jgi:membrane-bound ClpP family serine protease
MWIITGVLLGLLCLGAVVGFHFGPHAHVVAVALAVLVAGWFIYLISERGPGPVLWTLLGTDVIVGVGVGALAWKGLSGGGTVTESHHRSPLEGAEGIAVSRLAPEGIVSVRGEHWSAISVNGTVAASTSVQVLRAVGVRLEVWGEDAQTIPVDGLFDLRESNAMDQHQ